MCVWGWMVQERRFLPYIICEQPVRLYMYICWQSHGYSWECDSVWLLRLLSFYFDCCCGCFMCLKQRFWRKTLRKHNFPMKKINSVYSSDFSSKIAKVSNIWNNYDFSVLFLMYCHLDSARLPSNPTRPWPMDPTLFSGVPTNPLDFSWHKGFHGV